MGYCTQWTDLGLFPGARGPPGDCCRLVVTRIIADASTAFATGGGYIGGAHIGSGTDVVESVLAVARLVRDRVSMDGVPCRPAAAS